MSNSLRPHGLQHARLPCPSLSPGVCLHSSPLSWQFYLTILSSATLFFLCLQSFPSLVFSNLIRWPKYWSFIFSISPFNEYSRLISFRIYWFDLAGQKTLKSHLQQACILSCFHHVWLFCNPMDYNSPGSSVHGISQARIQEWVSISSSRGSSQPEDRTRISCAGRRILYHWITRKAPILKHPSG